MHRSIRWRWLVIAGCALLACAVAIVQWRVGRFAAGVHEAFRRQSVRSVTAFADHAEEWLVRGNVDAIEGWAELLVIGSGRYVHVATADGAVVDLREDDPAILGLDLALASEDVPTTAIVGAIPGGGLEVIAPIGLAGFPGARIGVVRIGFDGVHAASQIRGHRILVYGLALGAYIAAMGLLTLLWLWRRRRRRSSAQDDARAIDDTILRCGGLTIDTAACSVRVFGEEVVLTPKMYELLLFLAEHEGATFTDAQILDAVWADSTYAASGDVKQCIYMLRRRLADVHPDPKRVIVNVKGFGYRLVPPRPVGMPRPADPPADERLSTD